VENPRNMIEIAWPKAAGSRDTVDAGDLLGEAFLNPPPALQAPLRARRRSRPPLDELDRNRRGRSEDYISRCSPIYR